MQNTLTTDTPAARAEALELLAWLYRKIELGLYVGPLTITYHPEHDTEAKGMENAREA